MMPLVGAAADRTGRKKPLLAAAAYIGRRGDGRACSSWTATAICWAALLLIVANASLSVSMVLYNAYLPQIATPDERDAVSSRGWAFGYTAGAAGARAEPGRSTRATTPSASPRAMAVRICLASAGLWWGAFTLIPLRRLRDRARRVREPRAGPASRLAAARRDRCATCAATR